jgi:acyl-CoA synthetase (AMP-forming)/AMP-acid ligase II
MEASLAMYDLFYGTISYGKTLEVQIQTCRNLLLASGVAEGSLVALSLTETISFLAAYQACNEVGVVPLLIGKAPSPQTIAYKAKAEFFLSSTAGNTLQLNQLAPVGSSGLPRNIAVVCRTSGSTGESTFALWTKQGIDYQVKATTERMQYGYGDKLLATIPLWSAYGVSLVHLWRCIPITLVLSEDMKPAHLVHIINTLDVAALEGTPALYHSLYRWLEHHPQEIEKLTRVRIWESGGDLLPVQLAQRWLEMLNRPLLDGYGLTEAGPNVALNGGSDWKLGTVGKPLRGTEVVIDTTGELLVRGPGIMHGYWPPEVDHPLEFTPDGFLHTGDVANIDNDGYIIIQGRLKNMLTVNGYNVAPEMVESVLKQFPSITQAAVVGVRHSSHGHILYAFVVSHEELNLQDVKVFVAQHLEPICRPRRYNILPELPLNVSGKVDRRKLVCLAENILHQNVYTSTLGEVEEKKDEDIDAS